MPRSRLASATLLSAAALTPLAMAPAQQSDLVVSPFVSFLPSAGTSPLAGLALMLAGNGGLGLRASGHVALENSNNTGFAPAGTLRPWGADADAVLSFGGHMGGGANRTFAPFVFAGLGVAGGDNVGDNSTYHNWSYGAGASIPLGPAVDLFGESRWRMSRYVLPTAQFAPSPTTELRFGLSFHVGLSGSSNENGRRPRERRIDMARAPMSLPSTARYPVSTVTSVSASRLLGTAEQYVGVPYRYGGTSPDGGFDCSGFTQYVFAAQGVRLPRTSRQQAQVGTTVSPDWRAVAPGDLVLFEENGRIAHVAIYAGHNRIIHSTSSGGGVRYDDLSTPRGEWFMDHMVAVRRITPDPRGRMLDLARGFAGDSGIQLDPPDHAPRPNR